MHRVRGGPNVRSAAMCPTSKENPVPSSSTKKPSTSPLESAVVVVAMAVAAVAARRVPVEVDVKARRVRSRFAKVFGDDV